MFPFEFPAGALPSQMAENPPVEITLFDDRGESASILANKTVASIESELGKGLYARLDSPEDLSGFKITAFQER
jgi:hypothetical protein